MLRGSLPRQLHLVGKISFLPSKVVKEENLSSLIHVHRGATENSLHMSVILLYFDIEYVMVNTCTQNTTLL